MYILIPFTNISNLGTLSVYQKNIGGFESYKVVVEQSIMPLHFSEINNLIDAQSIPAMGLMFVGFITIFILEKLGNKKSPD